MTLEEAWAAIKRYRQETIRVHGFDIGDQAHNDIDIAMEWLYERGYVLSSRLVGADDQRAN